jgi:hypothetical protein
MEHRAACRYIDQHIFFWPGGVQGPIQSGLNHFKRYAAEDLAVLRIRSDEVFRTDAAPEPLFCHFNSGAPRVVNGRRSPRGADTYVPANCFNGSAGEVVEVVFCGAMLLPRSTEVAPSYAGPWHLLLDAAG